MNKYKPQVHNFFGYSQVTPPGKFKTELDELLKTCGTFCDKLIVIGINGVNSHVMERSPHYPKEIMRYNHIIQSLPVDYISTVNIPEEFLTDDAHITKEGHSYIYKALRRYLCLLS